MNPNITPIDRTIAHNIRVFRLFRGMTQQALAQAVGLTFQQIQKYEHAKSQLMVSRLHQIARVLRIKPELFWQPAQSSHERYVTSALSVTKVVNPRAPRRKSRLR